MGKILTINEAIYVLWRPDGKVAMLNTFLKYKRYWDTIGMYLAHNNKLLACIIIFQKYERKLMYRALTVITTLSIQNNQGSRRLCKTIN